MAGTCGVRSSRAAVIGGSEVPKAVAGNLTLGSLQEQIHTLNYLAISPGLILVYWMLSPYLVEVFWKAMESLTDGDRLTEVSKKIKSWKLIAWSLIPTCCSWSTAMWTAPATHLYHLPGWSEIFWSHEPKQTFLLLSCFPWVFCDSNTTVTKETYNSNFPLFPKRKLELVAVVCLYDHSMQEAETRGLP